MWPGSQTLDLTVGVFKILRELISEHSGLNYDDGKRDLLADKLSPIAVQLGFSNFLDFYYLLKYGPDSESAWPGVINALSVQETYFWREMSQIHVLANQILPELIACAAGKPVRIWSAACATGEEPLTIAMALMEAGLFDRADIQISASDVSTAAIARARTGFYREWSFRALPIHLRDKYFTAFESGWRITPELLHRVHWCNANLMNGAEIASLAHVPIIFCRNVFIYFTEETISRTARNFANRMQRPGYLFVGAAETLLRATDEFELEEIGGALVYALK
jgi:chemotaxis protein methyltransferase CheR